MKMKPLPKFLLILTILGGAWFGLSHFGVLNKMAPKGRSGANEVPKAQQVEKSVETIRVCVVTWGGYAGGQYFNNGFAASKNSRFYQDYGFAVEFIVNDDFEASRSGWKAGEYDLLWITADSFPTEAGGLGMYDPRIVFQADWSRGGDVIVGTRDINSMNDLRGKKIAVAFGTPSHTFLLQSLKAAGLNYNDIQIVEAPSAIDAAAYFKAGRVDAAVVWSPDDEDCLQNVPGSHVLTSTKVATHIIPDVFYAKKAWIDSHQRELAGLIEGWLKGAGEINTDPAAKEKAVQILAAGLNMPEDFCRKAINNVRLCTYGDNANFFNLSGNYQGVKGEDVYSKTGLLYQQIGMAKDMPAWRSIIDTRALREVKLYGPANEAEAGVTFAKMSESEGAKAPALATKRLSVSFATGSYVLDSNAKTIIDLGFGDVSKNFGQSRIRIEGNTDSTGGYDANVLLSRRRAQAVADYLASQYGFDPNRFVVIGNGPNKPIASNDTEEGRAQNRRTDFELLR